MHRAVRGRPRLHPGDVRLRPRRGPGPEARTRAAPVRPLRARELAGRRRPAPRPLRLPERHQARGRQDDRLRFHVYLLPHDGGRGDFPRLARRGHSQARASPSSGTARAFALRTFPKSSATRPRRGGRKSSPPSSKPARSSVASKGWTRRNCSNPPAVAWRKSSTSKPGGPSGNSRGPTSSRTPANWPARSGSARITSRDSSPANACSLPRRKSPPRRRCSGRASKSSPTITRTGTSST